MLYVQILIVFALIVLNGFFAMSELAVVSARKARLKTMAREGVPGAAVALRLANEPGIFLPTVQIGITLIGVLAGAFSGATLAEPLGRWLSQFPVIQPFANGLAITLVVVAITYLSLIIGELAPKQMALHNAEGIAARVARPMRLIARISAPAVWLLRISSDLVLRLLGLGRVPPQVVTEDEIRMLIAEGTEAGVFERSEREIINRVLRLDDRSVQSIMTPRIDIVWLDIQDTPSDIARKVRESGHSRYLVCRGSLDNVLGIVLTSDLLLQHLDGPGFDLPAAVRQAPAVHESTTALEALEILRQSPVPLALVVDEYGTLQGIVTINDVTQAIVGTMRESERPEEPRVVPRADGTWLVDGLLPIAEVAEHIGLPEIPEESGFHTLAGFVMAQLGRVPKEGDRVTWRGWNLEVVDMDGRRIDKLLITPPAEVPEEEPLD